MLINQRAANKLYTDGGTSDGSVLLKLIGKNISDDPMNYWQYVNKQTIGKIVPSLEEQTNYVACLNQRGEKNDDVIANCRKTKCIKRMRKAKDELRETDNGF